MRVVVTGASGNVGTALLRNLLARDHAVVGLCRRPPSDGTYARADWRAVDLSSEDCLLPLQAAMAGADAVVHLAWCFQPTRDRDHLEAVDVGGTRRVLTAAAAAGVPHVVHQSSVGVYAPRPRDSHRDDPVDEGWPAWGIRTSTYSRHKVEAERLLDDFEREHPDVVVTRTRPALVGQRRAGSSLLRYGLPAVVPAPWLLRLVPVLPLDRRLRVSLVHADDLAEALRLILDRQVGGIFNISAGEVTAEDLASELRARLVHVPAGLLRLLVAASWRARLQPVSEGWLDLAYAAPVLSPQHARATLGWRPEHPAREVLAEALAGMREGAYDDTPVLRRRTVRDGVLAAWRQGGVAVRAKP
jgi:nucleoside-diphosphate-sugar epimerase